MSQQLRRAAQELLSAYDNGCPMHMDWDRLRKALADYLNESSATASLPVEEKKPRDADYVSANQKNTTKVISSSTEDLVLRITTAYEQGFGQALRTDVANPYVADTVEAEAWDHGREVGKQKALKNKAV